MPTLTLPIDELNAFDLPPVCLITGEKTNVTFREVKFSWYPRWIPLLILVPFGGLFLAVIVARILTRRVAGELPFSERGWSRWRVGKAITVISVLWVLAGMYAGVSLVASERYLETALVLGAVLAVPLALHHGLQRSRMVIAARITETEVTFRVPSEEAVRVVLDHLHPNRWAQAAPVTAGAR